MTDADDRLKALFAADEPPARDPQFSAAVMAEVARRQFVWDVGVLSVAAGAVAGVLWASWPTVAPALAGLGQSLLPVGACLTLAASAILLFDGRFSPVARLET
jgi:hypothetical protein